MTFAWIPASAGMTVKGVAMSNFENTHCLLVTLVMAQLVARPNNNQFDSCFWKKNKDK
ncbi:MAG: hypothetical protein K2W99_02625 [Chthoniobacterales bacterium]|nr:hypothetical protein [Chthoniobacterales bacterium]